MRHRKKFNHLGRKAGHRKALLKNMASSLLISDKKRIITTLAKARELRTYVEPLITKAKTNSTHSRRVVFSYLQNKEAVTALFGDIAAAVGDRPGGYTRILKIGPRKGDNAEMALIELVDFNEFAQEKPKKKTRRKKKSTTKANVEKTAPAVEEVVVAEVAEEMPEISAEVEVADSEEAVNEDIKGEEE